MRRFVCTGLRHGSLDNRQLGIVANLKATLGLNHCVRRGFIPQSGRLATGKGEDTTHNQKKRNKQRRVHGNSLAQYRKYANFIARRNRIEESQ